MGVLENLSGFLSNIPTLITNTDLFETKKVRSSLLLVCIIFLLIVYIQYLWKRKYLYYHSWNIPGPFAFPVIGIGYLFLSSKTSDLMKTIIDTQSAFPDICRFWFGPNLYYSVTKPEQIEKIIKSHKAIEKDYIYKFMKAGIGDGIFTAKAKKWKIHRRAMVPAFNQRALNNFQQIFARQSEVFVSLLQKQYGNKDLDLLYLASNCALDILCETTMGLRLDLQNTNTKFVHNLDKIMEITTIRMFHVWHHLEFIWNWSSISKEYNTLLKDFKDFTGSVIQNKMDAINKKNYLLKSMVENMEEEPPKNLDFLDILMENSNFTKEELREEVDLILVAGTDTTGSTLSFIFIMLGMFPDVQQKILEEIIEIMGPDRTPISSDLRQMKYTERVIKETLRLFPPVPMLARQIKENIEIDDLILPAGSSAFFSTVFIHRNPKYWPDPLKFDPDRFLPENVKKRHPCSYIAFSYGPRDCIGKRYAMMNLKTILAVVLRKVKIFTKYEKVEDVKLKMNIMLRVRDGPQVWVENREQT